NQRFGIQSVVRVIITLDRSPCDVPRHVKPLQNECTLGWDNLSYTVSRRGQHPKVIINRVSGRAAPGELVAIMGPSGSGKTTLLDILADRISSGQVTGQIDLNGRPRPVKTFRLLSSYVSQEDALTGSFTVLETLRFAARLSVPANVLATEREGRVQAAIDDMGILTIIAFLTITVAVSKPTILLLDEPTSGLDAASTYNVMAYIQKLCLSQKHTVICTIHQPSTKVYTMFAKVLVLAQGETVFFGSPHDLLLHFANIGYLHQLLPSPHLVYHFAPLSKADLREMKPSVGRQFLMVLQRTALENVRNPGIFWMRFVMFFALSAMSGTLYLNHDHQLTDVDLVSLLFGAPAFTTFLSVAALPFFLDQRAVFSRERANSGLNVGAYAVATFVAGLPGLALLAITTTVMVVPMTGLRGFGSFFGIMFASLTSAESFMCVLGVLVPNAIMGIAVGSACFGMFVLTEGFMVPKPAIQPYWLWGHYLGFHTYSFEALVANQFQGVNTPSADA
ncbi:hypothetical protein DYB25_008187, partial [Aphanomyces astaci]